MSFNLISAPKELKMSSREISTLCQKEHKNVLPIIKELVERGVLKCSIPSEYINDQNRQTYTEYLSDKRDSLVIVARLSPEFTAVIIDRWQELESQNQFSIPKTYSEALLLASEQAKQLEIQAPKVKAFDMLIGSDTLFTMNQAAKHLGWGRNKLFKELRNRGILMQDNLPYQQHIDSNKFVVKETLIERTIGTKVVSQTYVTTKGEVWLFELLGSNNNL